VAQEVVNCQMAFFPQSIEKVNNTPHVCSYSLAAFAEPPTTSMTILDIRTDSILDSDVWGVRHPSGFSIRPSCNDPRTILTVSVLFNELGATWRHLSRSRARFRAIRNARPGIYIPFVVQCEDKTVDRWIHVKVFPVSGLSKSKPPGS
jgi:hypothetical protein